MKKPASCISLITLGLLLFVGCTKSEQEIKHENIKISGIYHSVTYGYKSGASVQYSFGFNAIDNQHVDGGLRIIVIGPGVQPYIRVYKARFDTLNWWGKEDGTTLIYGRSDFGNEEPNDFRVVEFRANLINDTVLDFMIYNYYTQNSGRAILGGRYITSLDSAAKNYIGSYDISYSESDNNHYDTCYPPGYCYAYENTMKLTGVSLDGIGGLNITGNFSGQVPVYGNELVDFSEGSDIYGGNFYIGAYNWAFSIRGYSWKPKTNATGVYRIDFHNPCTITPKLTGTEIITPSN